MNMGLLEAIFFLLPFLIAQVNGQGIGLVFIGVNGSSTVEEYSFNERNAVLSLPFYVELTNSTDGIWDNIEIDVTCILESYDDIGYSDATFEIAVTNPFFVTEGTVTFTNPRPGRRLNVRCYGETQTDPNIIPQFTRDASISPPVLFVIRPTATVDICSDTFTIKRDTGSGTPQFIVELSEIVENDAVNITCNSYPTTNDPANINIESKVVDVGTKRTKIEYRYVNGISPILVSCFADSQTTGEKQFDPDLSRGRNVTFTLAPIEVEIYPTLTNVRNDEFGAFLVLSETTDKDVEFTCGVQLVDTVEEARDIARNPTCIPKDPPPVPTNPSNISTTTSTTAIPPTNPPTPPASAGTTLFPPPTPTAAPVEWTLSADEITISKNGLKSSKFEVRRLTEGGNSVSPELVVVQCCATELQNPDSVYLNKSATLLAKAYLNPYKYINWTSATIESDLQLESIIKNPAYVEFGPCPCDVTENSCDTDCCCDSDCEEGDKSTFNCITGVFGGDENDGDPQYLCSTTQLYDKKDWFPIMCVQFMNSAFLGYFNQPVSVIRNKEAYETIAEQFRSEFSFERNTNQNIEEEETVGYYKEGDSVRTSKYGDRLISGPNYRLTLPQRSLSGQCLWAAPVRYLQNKDDYCVVPMSESICSLRSPLNAQLYAQSTQWNNPVCPKGTIVVDDKSNTETTVAFTDVNYLCADDAYVKKYYLQSTDNRNDVYPNDKKKIFGLDDFNSSDCYFDQTSGAFLCENYTIGENQTTRELPPRCTWDDGYSRPLTPTFDNITNICENSVLDVYYNFTWRGSEIVLLNATVILGNIPLMQEKTENVTFEYEDGNSTLINSTLVTRYFRSNLTQVTRVQFVHILNESVYDEIDLENFTRPEARHVYERSGSPGYTYNENITNYGSGYEFSKPVLSGLPVYDEFDELEYVDLNDSSRLSLWKPGPDGLCEGSDRERILFGENTLSSCMLRLDWEELMDCDNLRKLVLNRQDNLMMSSVIAMVGDPDLSNLGNDWLQVLREDISSIVDVPNTEDDTEAINSTEVYTTEVPTTDSMTTDFNDEYNETYTKNYMDLVTGYCKNIPSGIHVDIMYAEAGKSNSVPIWNIIGAKLSYTLDTWRLYCIGSDSVSCYNDFDGSPKVQTFIVSSSVNFVEAPAKVPAAKTRYELDRQKETDVCRNENCWEGVIYPFLPSFTGEGLYYGRGFGLASIIFVFGYFMVTRPWW